MFMCMYEVLSPSFGICTRDKTWAEMCPGSEELLQTWPSPSDCSYVCFLTLAVQVAVSRSMIPNVAGTRQATAATFTSTEQWQRTELARHSAVLLHMILMHRFIQQATPVKISSSHCTRATPYRPDICTLPPSRTRPAASQK